MDMRRCTTMMLAACLAGMLGGYLYAGILNPLNTEWLLQEGDLLQHYLGWRYFRHEAWSWPLGALQTYGSEVPSSIVFTDSLPLLALPLKLVQAWLPEPFQYQGLASLGHLMLNAIASCLLFTRLKLPTVAALALSLVVAFMPAVLFRGPGGAGHESLMAHWALLFALYLLLFATNSQWGTCVKWCGLLCVAVLVHFYLFLLVGCFWSLWWLLQTLAQWRAPLASPARRWWYMWCVYSVLQPLMILLIMWAVGYFYSGGGPFSTTGFGVYAAELFAYFNSYSFLPGISSVSYLMPQWLPINEGQYEGMSYVGLGVLCLWCLALVQYCQSPLRVPMAKKWQIYSVAALAVGLFVFALSDHVVVGKQSISLPILWPEPLKALVRSSGRMTWVLMYLSIVAAAFVLVKRLETRWVTGAMLMVLAIQMADQHRWLGYLHQQSQEAAAYRMAEDPSFAGWQSASLQHALSERQAIHITSADDIVAMLPIAWLASEYRMSINIAYAARITPLMIQQATHSASQSLTASQLAGDLVYAITCPDIAQRTCSRITTLRCVETPLATFAWQPKEKENL